MSYCYKRDPYLLKYKKEGSQPPQTSWFTARGAFFQTPENVYKHSIADLAIEKRPIKKYRIQLYDQTWTDWYYPGYNDVEHPDAIDTLPDDATESERVKWNSIWNEKSYNAGRRRWTSFDDHNHEICFYPNDKPIDELVDCETRGPQGEAWTMTSTRGGNDNDNDNNNSPLLAATEDVYLHGIADLLLDQRRIARYRIKGSPSSSSSSVSPWFVPGDGDTMNQISFLKIDQAGNKGIAGSRLWSLFATNQHEVCYYRKPVDFPLTETGRALAAKLRPPMKQQQQDEETPLDDEQQEMGEEVSLDEEHEEEDAAMTENDSIDQEAIGADKWYGDTILDSLNELIVEGHDYFSSRGWTNVSNMIDRPYDWLEDGQEYLASRWSLSSADLSRTSNELFHESQEFLSNSQEALVKTGQQVLTAGQELLSSGQQQLLDAANPRLRHAREHAAAALKPLRDTAESFNIPVTAGPVVWVAVMLGILCCCCVTCLKRARSRRVKGHGQSDDDYVVVVPDSSSPPSAKQRGCRGKTIKKQQQFQSPATATTKKKHRGGSSSTIRRRQSEKDIEVV